MQTVGGATALMYACQQCRETQVLDLIKKQPHSVKERDRTLKTPLHYCAENANTSCAEAVLRAAPELVNAQDENGYSTLLLGVIAGNKALIKLLITKGADVNVYDNEGHSAVHWAIVSSEKEALEMIIRAGANPSTPDVRGGYPLHYAVQMCGSACDYIKSFEDAIRVVETLLNFGVDVNVKDKDSRQPILWAASAGSADAVVLLVSSGACVEAADKDGLTALHCAASRGHTTTLETLITLCGANVDVIDGNGCSALFYAVTLGHADSTELLLRLGAEPNRQDRKGRTPAHCGAAKGQLETLRILQKHGGNLWLRNVKGDIPLHEAVASGRKDLVLWLLSQNPEAINIANNDGRCPLHIASMYNNTEMVKVLLDSKSLVNPVMRTSKGILMTPLNVALCKGHRSCGKYLQLHGGVPFSKVARLEPGSGFAVRGSPSDEMMLKAGEMSKEVSGVSQSKISKSRSSGDIQGSQESDKAENAEKKKVYRRRKKKRSASNISSHSQNSDSDESVEEVKLKVVGSRKVKKSNGVGVNGGNAGRDERMKVKKVQVNAGKFQEEKNAKNVLPANSKTSSTREEGETFIVRTVTKTKTLQSSKSFNETKNVSDLSPEDFPPLMQTVNQLDTVMMEPDVDEHKVVGEGAYLKLQDVANVDSGCVSLTRETEVEEGNNKEVKVEVVPVGAARVVQKEENEKNEIEVKEEDETLKEVAPSEENSRGTVEGEKGKTEAKCSESKSSAQEFSARKSVKALKTSTNSGSEKKEDRLVKSEKTSSAESEGSVKHKKTVRMKSCKVTVTEQAKEKSSPTSATGSKDVEVEKVLSSETKGKTEDEIEFNKKPEVAEPEVNDLNEGVIIDNKIQAEVEDLLGEVKKVESGDSMSGENEKEEKELSVGDTKNNESEEKLELLDIQPSIPSDELKSFEGDEGSGMMVTKNGEENLNLFRENSAEVSNEMKTSDGAIDLPSDYKRSGNAEENFSETFSPGPGQFTSENFPKEDESFEEKERDETKQELVDITENSEARIVKEEEQVETGAVEENGCQGRVEGRGPGNQSPKEQNNENQKKSERTEVDNVEFQDVGCSRKNELEENRPPRGSRVSRLCRRQRNLKGDMNDVSVTQLVQNTVRKYHMERGIFYQLLELKRYQIRSGKANEQVLVKRLADEYERSRVFLGMKPYSGLYKFREFEKFLYDQLKALNARRSFLIPEIKSYDDIDALAGFLKKSRYKIIKDLPHPEMVCTCITQRCHHSAGAYTSVPCSAYITDLRRHRRQKPKREGLFPKIDHPTSLRSAPDNLSARPATLELIQGSEKHVITLPQNSPGKGKRYYVTFTIKGAPAFEEDGLRQDSNNFLKHRHAKSV